MRKLLTVIVLAAAAVGLAGCASASPTPLGTESGFVSPDIQGEVQFQLNDGYTITCIFMKSGYGGGPSCDWEGHQAWLQEKRGK